MRVPSILPRRLRSSDQAHHRREHVRGGVAQGEARHTPPERQEEEVRAHVHDGRADVHDRGGPRVLHRVERPREELEHGEEREADGERLQRSRDLLHVRRLGAAVLQQQAA